MPSLENEPRLEQYLEQPLQCLLQLSDERQIGMALGGIPYLAVVKWCELAGITDIDEIDDIAHVVNRADGIIQAHYRKKPQTLTPTHTALPKPVARVITPPQSGNMIGWQPRGR